MTYSNIIVDSNGAVGLITLNRPSALNALNNELIAELNQALDAIDADGSIGATVLTGSEKAFAAGADVKQMAELSFSTAYDSDFIGPWSRIANKRKPIIAAVAGYALGGGCELAMMCDIIIAADNAKFGQPEINLATIPGAGGTQRLTRAVGKSKAMDMILTGRMMDAAEAERSGLVTRVVPVAELIPEAIKMAGAIASRSSPVVRMAKDAVKAALETTLAEGLRYERQSFYATFATEDRTEGMKAFIDKRPAKFSNR